MSNRDAETLLLVPPFRSSLPFAEQFRPDGIEGDVLKSALISGGMATFRHSTIVVHVADILKCLLLGHPRSYLMTHMPVDGEFVLRHCTPILAHRLSFAVEPRIEARCTL